jgi:hypothetical protein
MIPPLASAFAQVFEDWTAGGENFPLLLPKPFSGTLQTGFHLPALDISSAMLFRPNEDGL